MFDMPGVGRFVGIDTLRATYEGWKPRAPQRHMVLNTLLTSWSVDAAEAVSDVVFVLLGKERRLVGAVRRALPRHAAPRRR